MPVKARRTKARRHLPSSRELASRDPQAGASLRLTARTCPRTVSPSLCSCPASGGASSILPASALLVPPRSLATLRRARRAMRPIDFCHPCELRAPAPRVLPARSAAFAAWAPHGVWAPCGLTGDPSGSRHLDRFGGPPRSLSSFRDLRCRSAKASVGVLFPRWSSGRASDVPVASPSPPALTHLRACSRSRGLRSSFGAGRLRVDRCGGGAAEAALTIAP